jgi:hypothetical protein
MDPITLIVTALAAGAASALQDDAKGAVGAALARLRALAKKRLGGRPGGEFVLAQHEQKPDVYAGPLEDELKESRADADTEQVSAAQELMKLVDAQGAAAGRYVVNVQNSSGVQVGDHNSQVNNFGQLTAGRDIYSSGRDMTINRSGDS